MVITKKPKPARRNETQDLTKPILAALNQIPGVRVARNNTGVLRDERGVPVRYGLGLGSADLVGVVAMIVRCNSVERFGDTWELGRVFCLEVKWPGEEPTKDQERWLAAVRRLGGFACVVHSVEEGIDAVRRCIAGQSE